MTDDRVLRVDDRLGDRYVIGEKLGAGGMGIVYAVLDLESGERVALKTLRRGLGDTQLIKHEFRTLADVTHPNLVQLYDLFDVDGQLCLTMELVPGIDLMTELRGSDLVTQSATMAGTTLHAVVHDDDTLPNPDGAVGVRPRDLWPPPDFERVRDRFAQLARGLGALHRRGVVHRDIKPHNVRVTPEGRVVLLDFGLASTTGATGPLAGTLVYMAPEQTEGAVAAPPADWYSYGVLLHEVLTGMPPWSGEAATVLRHKRLDDPPALASRRELPGDLATLADDLVRRDPRARPGGGSVLERLGQRRHPRTYEPPTLDDLRLASADDVTAVADSADRAPPRAVMVGRIAELAQLEAAWRATAGGRPAWIAIEGASGLGKTTLLGALAGSIPHVGSGVVLHGRCYELEAIAYKGIDQVVDALIAKLVERRVPRSRAAAELAHAFPAASELADGDAPAWHGHDRRGAALRELLAMVALETPVLVALDDIQWADRDCLALVAQTFAPPGIRGVMLAVTARPAPALLDTSATPATHWLQLPLPFARVRLAALPERDAVELAQRLAGRAAPAIDGVGIARASGGHPLELVERVRSAIGDASPAEPGATGRGAARELLEHRVAHASAEVRLIVELAATAGAPVPIAALGPTMALGDASVRAAIDRAQLAGLVRSRRIGGRAIVEAAHDHVREVVYAMLTPAERRARAALLAPILERLGHEAGHVAALYRLADRPDDARRCAHHAAERMSELGGHDAAAVLWAQVAELSTGAAARAALQHTADALTRAGRGVEAAELYQRLAATAVDRNERLRLLRRAAEELLRSGRIREGLALAETNLPDLREPRGATAAFVRGLALHAQSRAGMLLRSKRHATTGASPDREVLELQWAAIAGHTLGTSGHFMFAVERHLRSALRSGDAEHVALAWSAEATLATFLDAPRFAERCLHRAAAALGDTGSLRARGVATATAALLQLCAGMWTRASAVGHEASLVFDQVPQLVWERNTCSVINTTARAHAGELARLAGGVRRERERIAASNDLYAHEIAHTGFSVLADLLVDEPARASAAHEVLASRPTGVMTGWQRTISHGLIGAYGDRPAWHRARADELLAGPLALRILRAPLVLGTLAWTRAILELVAGTPHTARPWIDRLHRLPGRGMMGLAELLAGHAAQLAGDRVAARRHAAAAELTLTADAMPMFAASARWLRDPATWPEWRDALAKLGAVAPARLARVFAPSLRVAE